MGFFKTKEEKAASEADKAAKLIENNQFDDALKHLEKSIKKGTTDPQVFVLKQMILLKDKTTDPNMLASSIQVFEKYRGSTVMYGVHEIQVDRLQRECQLWLETSKIFAEEDSSEKAQKFLQMANTFMNEFGNENLLIKEVFDGKLITGKRYADELNGKGYEILAYAVMFDDPQKAAQYMQTATGFYKDLNMADKVKECEEFVVGTSKTVHCWICGKKVTGRFIHFIPMVSDITKPILGQADTDSPIPTNDANDIYVCRACYSAIDNHNKMYFRKSKEYTDQEVHDLRVETIRMIDAVNDRIDNLIDQLNRR